MTKIVGINNWSFINGKYYSIPNATTRFALHGNVVCHPKYKDGEEVWTTKVLSGEGVMINTKNNVYLLGKPDPYYIKWLEENDIRIDLNSPLKENLHV